MIALWNAIWLAAFGPLFFLPAFARRLTPAKATARKGDLK